MTSCWNSRGKSPRRSRFKRSGEGRAKAPDTTKFGSITKPGGPKRVKGQCPLQDAGTASLLGFGATPQLFLVQPTQKENSSRAALVAGSEASLRSNFARPQTRPQAALSNNRAVSRQMGATTPYAARRNLLFIPQNRSFLIANYPGGVPCPPNAFFPCCSCLSCC